MYSKNLKSIMDKTLEDSKNMKIVIYPLELLVRNIIQNDNVSMFLSEKNIDTKNLLSELELSIRDYLDNNQNFSSNKMNSETVNFDQFTIDVISRALLDIKKTPSNYPLLISEYNILAATLLSENSDACRILAMFDLTRELFYEKINKNIEDGYDQMDEEAEGELFQGDSKDNNTLSDFLTNLNHKAKNGKIDSLIGREDELLRISTILGRKGKNNPIITGLSGVGKTAAIEGLAKKIVEGECTTELKGKTIYSLDLGAMLAGTKYRGDFEKRLDSVIKKIKKENAILFIDEIHSILGAGSSSSSNDMSNQILPHLTSGDLTVIGATTNEEYIKIFEKNSALSRRFNKVNFDELSVEQTIELMHRVKNIYENYHKVKFLDNVIEKIVLLTGRYVTNNQFPDKALDVLDEIAATVKIDTERHNKDVTLNDVFSIISNMKKIPIEAIKDNGTNKSILNLQKNIGKQLFGQDKAIDAISESMMMAYAGLKRNDKPMGSFLCVGPTGVGKTELAKTLAKELNMNLIRFDMSEYMSITSANRFLGSDAGYVGYEDGGLLLKELKENPFSIVLFDEFEKAHPSIQNILLQVLDEGSIKDSQGRMVDFKNTIILFTSNAGVMKGGQSLNGIGFSSEHKDAGISMSVINETFTPEFRNRITGILEFQPLKEDSMEKVANKAIKVIADLILENRGISVKWSKAVTSIIAKEGYDPKMGARPIERKVQDLISKNISKMILKEDIKKGSSIKISKGKDDIFKFTID